VRCVAPIVPIVPILALAACAPPADPTGEDAAGVAIEETVHARLVDPFVGTAADGNTFPGAVAPWGLASPSPHTTMTTPLDYLQDQPIAPAGYVFGAPTVLGWGLTHLSGVGCPDLGAPLVVVGRDVRTDPDTWPSAYGQERAWPGYHALTLTDAGAHLDARVEATATERVAVLRVRFSGDGPAVLQLDATRNLSWSADDGAVHVAAGEVSGRSATGTFCAQPNAQDVAFVARVDPPPDAVGTYTDAGPSAAPDASGPVAGAWWRWDTPPASVEIRVGLSLVSVDGARANLDAEGAPFDEVAGRTLARWEDVLGAIDVHGGTDEDRRRLATALYHALIHPSVASDVDGGFRRFGGGVGTLPDGAERFHVFSLWDTYRNLHPLLALALPEQAGAFAASLVAMTAEAGAPPLWELAGQEVQMMVGDPAAIVLADAVARGLHVPDLDATYVRLRDAALDPRHRPGVAAYLDLGYVPMEQATAVWGPVSTTLEYALADFALAELAEATGHDADVAALRARAASWRHLLDPTTGLFRPRNADGSWVEPFDPDALQGSHPLFDPSGGPGYVEGTAWHYAFMVPHDVEGLAEALGGVDVAKARLDAIFDEGRYATWNEPDLHYPWLYDRLGAGGDTGPRVRAVLDEAFTPAPDGLPCNDDAGTMSAWVVLALIGLYPDPPGSARWAISAPAFDRVVLGDTVIEAEGDGRRVVAASLDGVPLDRLGVDHAELVGHTLRVVRGP
jgi:predicted alpha-1,2-mannosidase